MARGLAKHGLSLSISFIQQTAQRVVQIAVQKTDLWQPHAPEPESSVAILVTGLDSTTLLLREEDYKEALCGTIALYDRQGQRLSTTYLGAMLEAGKATFTHRFTALIIATAGARPR